LITEIVLKEFQEELRITYTKIILENTEFYSILCQQIDPGEASVIALASQEKECLMILDDLKGRKVASALNLNFTGTLGLLVKAKRSGLVSEIKPFINKLIESGIRISSQVLAEIEKDYP
jgi:predicted nucleic acid-binding protein